MLDRIRIELLAFAGLPCPSETARMQAPQARWDAIRSRMKEARQYAVVTPGTGGPCSALVESLTLQRKGAGKSE